MDISLVEEKLEAREYREESTATQIQRNEATSLRRE